MNNICTFLGKTVFLSLFLFISITGFAQLNGSYTIGGTTPNYNTFTDAVNALHSSGVSGPVVFNVRNGVYNEQISLNAITGASAVNTITFQSESGDSSTVTLSFTPGSSNNYVIRLNGTDYVTFKKISIRSIGASYATAIRYETGSTYNTFERNKIEGTSTTSSSTNLAVIYANASSLNNNSINENLIKEGAYGVYGVSASASFSVTGNLFQNQYYRGMEMTSFSNLVISRNTFTTTSTYTSYYTVMLSSCGSGLSFTKNNINIAYGNIALYMTNCTATSGTRGSIANNFISVSGPSANGYGMYIYNSTYQDFYYNSISTTRPNTSTYCMFVTGSSNSNLQFQNNIYSNTGGGYAFYTDYAGPINVTDYNDFYSTGTYIGYWAGTYCTTIAAWKTACSQDVHSVSIKPDFYSATNLHTQNYQLDNLGYPVAGITNDIDGQTRSLSTPDMGADEWATPVNDAGITSIDQALTYCIINDSVFVTIKNFGTANLTSAVINWRVNGTVQTPKAWAGNLPQGSSYGPFSVGYYNFNLGVPYSVYAWTTNPNGTTDNLNYNDTSSVLNKYKAMSGTYTIGGTSPDYANFGLAVTDLVNGGVCGPVVFNVRNGVYNEQVSISAVSGTSSVNTVTFQSESGDSNLVTITYAPTSTNNYTVRFNGCDYITFKKLKVIATGTSYATVFRYETGSTYNTVDRCIVQGWNTTSTSTNLAVFFMNASTLDGNIINGNKISDGSYGLYLASASASIAITGNTIQNQYYRAMEITSPTSLTISRNTVTTTSSYTSYYAIMLSSCGSNLVFTKNKISVDYGNIAIYLTNVTASSGARGLFANNFVSVNGPSANGYGLYIYNSTYLNFYYNSVSTTRPNTSTYTIFVTGSSNSNLQFQNNIFSNTGGGYAIYTDYASPINVCDYNDLYSTGTYLGYWAGTYCGTIATWRTASGVDVHSVSILPEFVSPTNLHTQAYLIDNLGYPLAGVSDDIDGQTRSLSSPDMGADEWTTPVNDAGVTSIDQALTYCITNDSVFVTIKNFGTANLTAVTINWTVNGVSQTPKAWAGNLPQGSSYGPFSIGYYNFNLGLPYSVYTWTSNPNGSPEGLNHNDTSKVLNKYKAMSGTYTIGGTSPNYANFALAVTDLVNGGVCGPVVFNVRNGVYNEQVSISAVSGTSSVNTVTFQSESGDSNLVTITYAPTVSNNYTVRFNGCDYVTFKKMKAIATGTSYATVFRYETGSTSNTVDRCIVQGWNTTSTSTNLAVFFMNASTLDGNVINGNKISDGSYGLYIASASASIAITGNTIQNQYYRAMEITSPTSLTISRNTVTTTSSYTSYYAIMLSSCGSNLVFTKNKISVDYGNIAIYLTNVTATSGARGLFANNFISVNGPSANGYGLYIYNSTYLNFYYNSVSTTRPNTSTYSVFVTGSSNSNLQFQNNIFSNTGGGYAIYTDYASPINVCDYNDLYSTGTYLGYWAGTYCGTIATWRTASGVDVHSVSILPEFVSPTNLHTQAYLIDNLGYPLAGVSDDIDGQTRSLSSPDMGADEWTTPVNDAGVTSIDQALTYCITNDSVFVTIKNFGTANLTAVTINWTVNGVSQTPKAWAGNLPQGSSYGPFSIGYYNFNLGLPYSVYTWTSNPNGSPEGLNHNDTSKVLNKYKAMSGTYTIGGTSPNYANFGLAVTDLVNGGVCGPVVFNVRNGVYNEQVSISAVSGTSSVNTVTFQSETGDSNLVTITYAPTVSNNYTVRFNGCDYVTFKKMKAIATGTSYATVFRYETGSTSNTVDRCIVQGWNTTSTSTNLAVFFMNASTLDGNIINGNKISDGSYGLYIASASASIAITGNTIQNQYYRAMEITSPTALTISRNTITTTSTYTSYYAIMLSSCGSNLVFTKNKISVDYGNIAIYLTNVTASSGARGLFANNFISVNGASASGYGMYIYNSTYLNFYYNSVSTTRPNTSTYSVFVTGSSNSNLQFQNNIFSNTGGGYAIYTDYASPINVCDYNDLYSTGTYLGYWAGTYCGTIATWRTASGKDVHSLSVLPGFASSTDLHICNASLNGAALPVAGVSDDFDGQLRDVLMPDMGADEFGSVLSVNLGADIVTCTSVVLDAGNPGSTYLWSTGATTQTISTATPGSYWVQVTNPCGSGSDTVLVSNTPAVPGIISGPASVCASQTGIVYTIASVPGATTYNWTLPSGWNITAGTGTTSITATSSATSGNICVTSGSGCASSTASCTSVSITTSVAAPGSITGNTAVCSGEPNLNYTISAVSGATGYTWTVPAGWTINSGQGSTGINVTAGTAGGNICVTASNACSVSSQTCQAIGIATAPAIPGTITGSNTVCANATNLTYTIGTVSGATSYNWTVPSGWTIVSGQGSTTLTVNAGSTGGSLCVSSANSCSSSSPSCLTIGMTAAPAMPGLINGIYAICQNQVGITYSISAVSGASSYNWTVPLGWTITGGQGTTTISVDAGSSGGDVCVSSANSCASSSPNCATIVIQGAPGSPGPITGSNTVCASQGGLSYSISAVGGASSYNWTVPSGWIIVSGQGTTGITVASGTTGGDICVTAANSCSNSAAVCHTVTVQSSPGTPGTINGQAFVCLGQSGLTYNISPVSGATSYNWTVPADWILVGGQGTNIINVAAGSISGDVCVTAINSCASSSPACSPVSVLTIPAAPASIIGPVSVCAGTTAQQYIAATVSGASSYIWTLPGGWSFVSGQGNDTISINIGTVSGSLSVIASNACGASSSINSLIVVNAAPATPVITQNADTLYSSAASGNQWYLDGSLIPGATDSEYLPQATGWYTVSTTNGSGCTSTSAPFYYLYTSIVNSSVTPSASIYPNPSTGTIFIALNGFGNEICKLKVYDMLGKEMISGDILPGTTISELNTGLIPGIYTLRITSGNTVIIQPLVIQ